MATNQSNSINYVDPSAMKALDKITITPEALAHFRREITKQGSGVGIRLSLKTSGCNGYRYVIEVANAQQADDKVFPIETDFTIFVVDKWFDLIKGSHIEYHTEGLNKVVKIKNPNESSRCGCGESIAIDSIPKAF